MRNIKGDKNNIFNGIGTVDIDKCIGSIFAKIGDVQLDIDTINSVANSGGIYVASNGKIFNTYTKEDEALAKYKIIPTGLVLKGTRFPIFASFLKFENKKEWQGVYVGTGEDLFKMYKQHYYDATCFDNNFINVFCGPRTYLDIRGFGLKEVLANNVQAQYESETHTVFESEDKVCTDMKRAIQKYLDEASKQDSSAKGKRAAKKAINNANMLKQRLEKIQAKNKKQNNTKTEETKNQSVDEEVLTSEKNNEQKGVNSEDFDTQSMSDNIEEQSEQALCGNMNADFVQELYSRMLYKESWMTNGNRRFDFYIKNIIRLLENERLLNNNSKQGNGYLYSKDYSMCILNIGILDIYGNNIYILDLTPNQKDFKVKRLKLVDSKIDLLDAGFCSEEIKYLPDSLDLSRFHKDCVFDANIEDFDFINTLRLNHIIEERRSRFPDKFKDESVKLMCDKLKEAISLAIKISKTDCRYIIPKYDFERKKIQFMIPFHLDNRLDEPPELAIVVGKQKDVWCIHTVISLDDAIADARILFRTTSWLRS